MNSYKCNNSSPKVPAWCIGLAIGIVFSIAGIVLNQHTDILRKASMICLECIGIG